MKLEKELFIAIKAVRQACEATKLVSREMQSNKQPAPQTHSQHKQQTTTDSTGFSMQKVDASPVTVADYTAQAIINYHLKLEFPHDSMIAEEDSNEVQSQPELAGNVLKYVNASLSSDEDAIQDLPGLFTLIDYGKSTISSSNQVKKRFWVLDPVDGTKGFLRGGQYAVCLALIQDGQVELGVIGCPNLAGDNNSVGQLFHAVKGQGAFKQPLVSELSDKLATKIKVSKIRELSQCKFCESVESGHSNQKTSETVAQKLGITKQAIRMDSQCKYGVVAMGGAEIYMRLPVKANYQEKIWDHAAGDLLVREAGGICTDINGKPLDFSCGSFLSNNQGVIASNCQEIHANVLSVLKHSTNS